MANVNMEIPKAIDKIVSLYNLMTVTKEVGRGWNIGALSVKHTTTLRLKNIEEQN